MKFNFNAGAREEVTHLTSSGIGQVPLTLTQGIGDPTLLSVGFSPQQPVTTKSSYAYFLPSIDMKLNITDKFDVRFDHDFVATMRGCMNARPSETWINDKLVEAYVRLHQLGFAHSVECWHKNELVGGLYGVSLGGAFFGESMFHTAPNASKVALVHLVERLRQRKYALLDTQATTPHLKRFGCIEISAREYERKLRLALALPCSFD
jgi:leucyl/phenylalanyl-tRNA--protein transferase